MLGIIIQARIGSTRLPNKVMAKIEGKTVLEHVIGRAKLIKNCDAIILAVPDTKENNVLAESLRNSGALIFRGSENDVLDRYYRAAKAFNLDAVARITADCPLLDPAISEKVIELYKKGGYDYVSNVYPPTFPDGYDIEVFSFISLENSWQTADLESEREHVTPNIAKNAPSERRANLFCDSGDYSKLRFTIDESKDYDFIKAIYKELYEQNPTFGFGEIMELLQKRPELLKINQGIERNEGYKKSLANDKKIQKNGN